METYTIIGVAVVAAAVLVMLFKARTDRFLQGGGGRVTMESQSSTAKLAIPTTGGPDAQADAIESALAEVPETARVQAQLAFKGLSASHGFKTLSARTSFPAAKSAPGQSVR